jgi:hypothetical protein
LTTSTTPAPALTRNRVIFAAIFAVVALIAVVVAFAIGLAPAHTLPTTLAGGGKGHHPLRVVGIFLVGVVFAVAAYFSLKYEGPAEDPE